MPFFTVIVLVLLAFAGVKMANLHFLFGVLIPYAAVAIFIAWFHLSRCAMGTFACTIPYTYHMRPDGVISLDQAKQA